MCSQHAESWVWPFVFYPSLVSTLKLQKGAVGARWPAGCCSSQQACWIITVTSALNMEKYLLDKYKLPWTISNDLCASANICNPSKPEEKLTFCYVTECCFSHYERLEKLCPNIMKQGPELNADYFLRFAQTNIHRAKLYKFFYLTAFRLCTCVSSTQRSSWSLLASSEIPKQHTNTYPDISKPC